MNKENKAQKRSTGERLGLYVFGISFGLFILNILIGKAAILWNLKVFQLGNVGEFLVLLISSVSLIAAAIHQETAFRKKQETDRT